jgi:hypothetical protein
MLATVPAKSTPTACKRAKSRTVVEVRYLLPSGGYRRDVLSPTAMHLAAAALVCGLAIAILLPAPAANEDGLLTALLGTVCCATLLMGGLALAGVLTGTAILAATGAALMVPCAWLARAPEAPYYVQDYEEEDDDGGGSPPAPRDPSPPPGPEHWRPAPAPAAALFAKARTALAPDQPGIVPAQAGTALAAQHAVVTGSAARAELPANPRFPHLAAVAWATADRPAPPVVVVPPVIAPAPVVVAPIPPAPVVVAPIPPPSVPVATLAFEAPAVRPARGEHASVEHRVAAAAPTVRRRRHFTRLRVPHGWRRRRWFVHSADGDRATR